MPTLYLMRHAKSDWHSAAKSDFDRPLNKRGSKDAARMGQWLLQHNIAPSLILSSPAQRAKLTAMAVAEAMGLVQNRIQFNKDLYLADRATLIKVLHVIPESTDSVLLVAHNPGMDDLVEWLTPELPPLSESGKLMTTAAIAVFAVSGPWAELKRGTAPLRQLLRPKELA
jgi:phosphohistidine phosphatase